MPYDNAPIEFRISKMTDWTYAVICALGFVLFASVAFMWLPGGDRQGMLALLSNIGYRLATVIMAYVCGVYGYAAIWRLRTTEPAFRADPSGLNLHPSFYHTQLQWSDITWMGMVSDGGFGRRSTKLAFRLRSRFWSVNQPLSSQTIKILRASAGWSYKECQVNLKRMRQWQRASIKT